MRWPAAVLVSLAVFGAACGGGTPSSGTHLELGEFTIDATSTLLAAGSVELQLDNIGDLPHTVVVSTESGEVVAASDVLGSGETAALVLTLEPGEYQLTCRIVAEFDGELLDHYELGMVRSVTVTS